MKQRRPGYSIGERLDGVVERIVPGGAGLVRGPNGVVLVDRAAPGDRSRIEIESERSGAPRGVVVSILESGLGRVDPPCPWYGRCGGCDFQHLDYSTQIEAKLQIVQDAFARIGGIGDVGKIEVHPAPRPFGSRARIELHADRDANEIGFFERRSRSIVPIEHCIVSREELNSALEAIRESGQPFPPAIQLLGGRGEVRGDPAFPPVQGGSFWLRVGDFDYLVDPGSFFQSSLDLLPELIEHVVGSPPTSGGLVWDLYCGAGLFSLPLAKCFERVLGVDLDRRTIDNARKSADRNGIHNASFTASDASVWMSERKQAGLLPDLIVVDPPRSGLEKRLVERIATQRVERLTYVSCDPTTLARDLRILTRGAFRLLDVAIFDLFPQTHHVETVVRLAAR